MPRAAGINAKVQQWVFRYWPLRGLARSHRYSTCLEACGVPVGAGLPARGPGQAYPTNENAAAPFGATASDQPVWRIRRTDDAAR
ncbi:hypothetical protein DBB42_13980 [Pseudomonas plecoglossicida]|uniref:Uncharacterized protein n=1 Tax=Pseudomonas plecoglossicida TaxID=70775 RepID=A0A2R7UHR0_PSEDL|nr:hypothetical protein DBB42_13980 [Pseudomonas plecoglossicida]